MAVIIPSGDQNTTYSTNFNINSADTYDLQAGTLRRQVSSVAISANVASGATTINILGALKEEAVGTRALNATLTTGAINIGAAGSIQSVNADTVRVLSPSGRTDLTNLG